MADTDNKNNGIKIDISYKYNNAGMKKAIADVDSIDTQTARGIQQTKKNINGLISASKSMAQYLTKDSEVIIKSLEKQQKAYETVQKAQLSYGKAKSSQKVAGAALKATKANLLGAGNIIKGGKVFDKDGILNEKATSKLIASTERLKNARASAKMSLISLQSAENSYKNSILATADAQNKIALDKTKNIVDAVKNSIGKLSDKIKKIDLMRLVAQIYVLKRVWNQLVSLIGAASDWVENLNLLEVVFGDAADAAKDFVKATANNLGLDANELAQYAATFKQMANAMGQSAETGTQLSKALTYLALDVSSLRNVDVKTAMSDLASGIAGQIKPVRKYGADITEDSINAMLKQYGSSYSNLSQADKQLARTLLLIRQLKDSWGDMAKTINTFSNQQRVLNSQFETFKRLVGSILVGTFKFGDSFEEASKTAGIATKAIWYLNGAILAINELLAQVVPQAESVNSNVKTSVDDLTDSFLDLEDAQKGSLLSFDKFNTLSGGGSKSGVSALLEQLFGKESKEYIELFESSMKDSSMYAKTIAQTFLTKMFPEFGKWLESNPDGVFADWAKQTGNLKDRIDKLKDSLFGIITLLIGIKSPIAAIALAIGKTALGDSKMMDKIVTVVAQLSTSASDLLPKIADIAVKLAPIAMSILEIVVNTLDWLNKNNLLEPALWLIISALVAFKALDFGVHLAEIATKSKGLLSILAKLANTNVAMYAGIAALGVGLAYFISNLDKLGSTAKIVIPVVAALAAAIAGVAIGLAAASSGGIGAGIKAGLTAAAIAAGVTLTAGTLIALAAEKHADGGFQRGGAFIAGEKGPEWVGRQGGTSMIMNDRQMDDIMTDSVARGVKLGMASSYGDISRANSGSTEAAVYLDGNKVGRYVAASAGFRGEANRRNTSLNWK
jgi:hypothetical protein